MSLAKQIEETKIRTNIILVTTKHITEEDLEVDPNWSKIHSEYLECSDSEWLTQATVSLINSIYHQKRKAFGLSRESLRNLLKSDKNWEKPIGLKDSNYKKFLDHVFRGKFLENIPYEKTGISNKLMVVKVIHKDILKMFDFDIDSQISESVDFAKKQNKKSSNIAKSLKEKVVKEKVFSVTEKVPAKIEDAFESLQEIEQKVLFQMNAFLFRTKEWRILMKDKKYKEATVIESRVLNKAAFEYLKLSKEQKTKTIQENN